MKIRKSNNRGFTLIEVVLVLAIGGLIFLLAFLAFQQASINRRDTQRRQDAARVVSEVQNYAGDNNNTYPSDSTATGAVCSYSAAGTDTFAKFMKNYMCGSAGSFNSPQGTAYSVVAATTTPTKDQVAYFKDKDCNNTTSSGSVAVYVGLEKGVTCKTTASQ